MTCPVCENPPEAPQGELSVHAWLAFGHSAGKLRRVAEEAGLGAAEDAATGGLRIDTDAARLRAALDDFETKLSKVERAATRLVVRSRGEALRLGDMKAMLTLDQLIARLRGEWLLDAMRREAVSVTFEPISHADAPDEVFAHEARVGFESGDGSAAAGPQVLELAENANVLAALDRQARLASIRAVRAQGVATPVVVGFSPSAIYDPRFCLRTTVAAAEAEGVRREDVIFSILPGSGGADAAHLEDILGYYVKHGFRTALTISATRHASYDMLRRLKPDIVFVDASLSENVAADAFKEVVARKVLEIAHRLRMETVVSGVASAEDCDWAYSQGANYVQGPYVDCAARSSRLAAS